MNCIRLYILNVEVEVRDTPFGMEQITPIPMKTNNYLDNQAL
jgi:hypothetical protein